MKKTPENSLTTNSLTAKRVCEDLERIAIDKKHS